MDHFHFIIVFDLQEIKFGTVSKIRKFENYCFENTAIETISVPASVTDFCEGSFYYCKKLKSIEISSD